MFAYIVVALSRLRFVHSIVTISSEIWLVVSFIVSPLRDSLTQSSAEVHHVDSSGGGGER